MVVQQINEYDYYDATLTVRVVTDLIGEAQSSVLTAAGIHEEYAARVRAALREYRVPLDPYLEYYYVRQIKPAGSIREVITETQQVVLILRFSLQFGMSATVANVPEIRLFAFETNIEAATKALFVANSIPTTVIPGDTSTLGESFIDIICECGPATNIGAWEINT